MAFAPGSSDPPSVETAIATFTADAPDDDARREALNAVVVHASRAEDGLQGLVIKLGGALTSSSPGPRARATLLLAEVLSRATAVRIGESQARLLAQFFTERLQDFPTAAAAVHALLALVLHHAASLPLEAVEGAVKALFRELHVPSMAQAARQRVFELVETVGASPRLRPALAAQGEALVLGFCQAMEGEKDPRCLVVCLRLLRALARWVPSAYSNDTVVEEAFEVGACYFPVSFSPPPGNPHGITRDALAIGLRGALSAHPAMAPHLMSLLAEKGDSGHAGAVIEAHRCLAWCLTAPSGDPDHDQNRDGHNGHDGDAGKKESGQRTHGPALRPSDCGEAALAAAAKRAATSAITVGDEEAGDAGIEAAEAITLACGLDVEAGRQGAGQRWQASVAAPLIAEPSRECLHAAASARGRSAAALLARVAGASRVAMEQVLRTFVEPAMQQLRRASGADADVDSGGLLSESKQEEEAAALAAAVVGVVRSADSEIVPERPSLREHGAVIADTLSALLHTPPGANTSHELRRCAAEGLHALLAPRNAITLAALSQESVRACVVALVDAALGDPAREVHLQALHALVAIGRRGGGDDVSMIGQRIIEPVAAVRAVDAVTAAARAPAPHSAGLLAALSACETLCAVGPAFPRIVAALSNLATDVSDSTSHALRAKLLRSLSGALTARATSVPTSGSAPDSAITNAAEQCAHTLLQWCADPAHASHVSGLLHLDSDPDAWTAIPLAMRAACRCTGDSRAVTRVVRAALAALPPPTANGHLDRDSSSGTGGVSWPQRYCCARLLAESVAMLPASGEEAGGVLRDVVGSAVPIAVWPRQDVASEASEESAAAAAAAAAGEGGDDGSDPLPPLSESAALGRLPVARLPPIPRTFPDASFWAHGCAVACAEACGHAVAKLDNPDACVQETLGRHCGVRTDGQGNGSDVGASGVDSASTPEGAAAVAGAARLFAWVGAACVARNHSAVPALVRRMTGACEAAANARGTFRRSVELSGLAIAQAAGVVASPPTAPHTLPSPTHTVPFATQRFFGRAAAAVAAAAATARPHRRLPFLLIATGMARACPPPVLAAHADSVLPLLLQGVSASGTLREGSVAALEPALVRRLERLHAHVPALVPALCDAAATAPEVGTRVAALRALTMITRLPYQLLHPHRTAVVRALAKPLDDRKRAVRQLAVLCRNEWSTLQASR